MPVMGKHYKNIKGFNYGIQLLFGPCLIAVNNFISYTTVYHPILPNNAEKIWPKLSILTNDVDAFILLVVQRTAYISCCVKYTLFMDCLLERFWKSCFSGTK